METPTPIPAPPPAPRMLEGGCVEVVDGGEMDAGGTGELVEDADVDPDMDKDVEGVEDGMMSLLMDKVAEDDVAELDVACIVNDFGGRA